MICVGRSAAIGTEMSRGSRGAIDVSNPVRTLTEKCRVADAARADDPGVAKTDLAGAALSELERAATLYGCPETRDTFSVSRLAGRQTKAVYRYFYPGVPTGSCRKTSRTRVA
ncbi:hypothetical protein GCM10008965_46720 [Methylorubrum aminovorans]|nr:hypothetical protein GCM10025880_35470 [Methylorubrum aminovorans]